MASAAREWYNREPRALKFKDMKFIYDNVPLHNLYPEEIAMLVGNGGPLDSADQLMRAARYSGDIMQVIEHVHSIICSRWWTERFWHGTPTRERREAALSELFFALMTPGICQATVERLRKLLQSLNEQGTGWYARPNQV